MRCIFGIIRWTINQMDNQVVPALRNIMDCASATE